MNKRYKIRSAIENILHHSLNDQYDITSNNFNHYKNNIHVDIISGQELSSEIGISPCTLKREYTIYVEVSQKFHNIDKSKDLFKDIDIATAQIEHVLKNLLQIRYKQTTPAFDNNGGEYIVKNTMEYVFIYNTDEHNLSDGEFFKLIINEKR